MSKTKRFWWLKISEDFFNAKEIKFLRKVAGGDTFALIYQRMMILSLSTEGKLYFENIGNTFAEEIAVELDEEVKNVEMTLNYLKGKGLIDFGESDSTLEFKQVPSLIGTETNWARYKNQAREKELKELENVQSMSNYKEQEQEQDKELDSEKDKEQKSDVSVLFENYLKIFSEYTKDVKTQPRAKAKQVFLQLAPEQRQLAMIGAKNYIVWYDKTDQGPYYSKNAFAFLDDMLFMDYQEIPEASKVGDKKVSKAPEWSNPSYENKTTDEELAKLEKIRQDALSKLGTQENE
ncbi:phage replisome organizer protein [Lactococcus lactis]|uniref:Phage replisome organizer protein n=1 Tax=Lactococcus lactis TaxID=1358 RepID=A0AAP3Z2L2_9LACT|nr:phage replisome organiser protein [Lactococcus lactis]MDG4969279.1 phage replisome organizer protein [Lactococcus lactis]MDG4977210.1 phage replisome organizer protein [Lactococcus lactis]MDG5103374.1 phage replisome organizer protein [Lactococcus lactis]TNU78273.1 replisome organizer [Lactococcus lactis subsp. lactis]